MKTTFSWLKRLLHLFQKKKLRLDKNCVTFGEIFLKPHQTNWNVAKNNASVVADELPSQITIVHLFNS